MLCKGIKDIKKAQKRIEEFYGCQSSEAVGFRDAMNSIDDSAWWKLYRRQFVSGYDAAQIMAISLGCVIDRTIKLVITPFVEEEGVVPVSLVKERNLIHISDEVVLSVNDEVLDFVVDETRSVYTYYVK
jgi:hypothetical protein